MHSSEEWRDIKGYEGYYQVSNLGRVRSLDREVLSKGGSFRKVRSRVLLNIKSYSGYLLVNLFKEGKGESLRVHRLVMLSFMYIDNNEELHVNHIDGNKLNNNLCNLEWSTPTDNIEHAFENKLHCNPKKPVIMLSISGDRIKEFKSIRDAGKFVKGNHQNIVKVCKGKAKTAYGYRWEYIV